MSHTVTVSLQDIWLIVSSHQNGNAIQKLLRGGEDHMAFCFLMDWAKLRRWNTCEPRAGRGSCRYALRCFFSEWACSEGLLATLWKPQVKSSLSKTRRTTGGLLNLFLVEDCCGRQRWMVSPALLFLKQHVLKESFHKIYVYYAVISAWRLMAFQHV